MSQAFRRGACGCALDGGGRGMIVRAVAPQVELLNRLQGMDVVGGCLFLRLSVLLELFQQGAVDRMVVVAAL
jgi:hypothetical protein